MNGVIDICGSKISKFKGFYFFDPFIYIFKAVNYFKLLSLDASETADSAYNIQSEMK